MTFDSKGFSNVSASYSSTAPKTYAYKSTVDNFATVTTSGYFDHYENQIKNNDLIKLELNGSQSVVVVTGVDPVTTVSALNIASIPDDSLENEQFGTGEITTAKLASNSIAAANMTTDQADGIDGDDAIIDTTISQTKLATNAKYGLKVKGSLNGLKGYITTVGGDATEAFTVTGVESTDHFYVCLSNPGSNDVSLFETNLTADTITCRFSADPGNDAEIQYVIFELTAEPPS